MLGDEHEDCNLLLFVNRLYMLGQSQVHSKRRKVSSFTLSPAMHAYSTTNILTVVPCFTTNKLILTYVEHSKLVLYYYCAHDNVCQCGYTPSKVCMRKSGNNFREPVLSFHHGFQELNSSRWICAANTHRDISVAPQRPFVTNNFTKSNDLVKCSFSQLAYTGKDVPKLQFWPLPLKGWDYR